MRLNYFTFKKEDIECSHCSWKGKGTALCYGDFSEAHAICDMNCPSCFETIGFWAGPLKEELEKWNRENPGVTTGWE